MKTSVNSTRLIRSPLSGRIHLWLVIAALVFSTVACALSSPETLNDGKGTRENPVPPRTYALTSNYAVRALSVVRDTHNGDQSSPAEHEQIRVQFQIRCEEQEDEVCQLKDIRGHIRLVDANGIVYEPLWSADVDKPLEGEILGSGEKTGWLAYELPRGVDVMFAVADYGEDQRVFFQLP